MSLALELSTANASKSSPSVIGSLNSPSLPLLLFSLSSLLLLFLCGCPGFWCSPSLDFLPPLSFSFLSVWLCSRCGILLARTLLLLLDIYLPFLIF